MTDSSQTPTPHDTPSAPLKGSTPVTIGGESMQLLPQRAVWWPSAQTVLVADVHIGKAAAFRQLGVPVPSGTTDDTLQRLQQLLDLTSAQRLVVLGDLLHSDHAQVSDSIDSLRSWRDNNAALSIVLVRGNHDDRSGDPPADLRIDCVDPPVDLGGIFGLHEPDPSFPYPALAGHVHPAVRLQGRGRDSVRLPCFVIDSHREHVLLPAFGAFTGMHTLTPQDGQRFHVIAGDRVIPLPRQ